MPQAGFHGASHVGLGDGAKDSTTGWTQRILMIHSRDHGGGEGAVRKKGHWLGRIRCKQVLASPPLPVTLRNEVSIVSGHASHTQRNTGPQGSPLPSERSAQNLRLTWEPRVLSNTATHAPHHKVKAKLGLCPPRHHPHGGRGPPGSCPISILLYDLYYFCFPSGPWH